MNIIDAHLSSDSSLVCLGSLRSEDERKEPGALKNDFLLQVHKKCGFVHALSLVSY